MENRNGKPRVQRGPARDAERRNIWQKGERRKNPLPICVSKSIQIRGQCGFSRRKVASSAASAFAGSACREKNRVAGFV